MSAAPAERWTAVRRVFDAAVELPREQRDDFLAAADLDVDTRDEVRMLLEASDSAIGHRQRCGSFSSAPAR